MYALMSAGPTRVHPAVMQARSLPFPNPDQDLDFVEAYHRLCQDLSTLLGSSAHETLILGGEGILGLEAAIASLTERGDRALVLDNGIFGAGFADFISMYGGEAVCYSTDYSQPLDPEALRRYLETDHNFKYATVVHCDTPSGMLNNVDVLCPILQEFGILTVVDSVAAMFGEALDIKNGMDIVCGGSQKVVSAPPGLAFVTLSPRAWSCLRQRKSPIASFYANLMTFASYYEDKWFPYTMPASDLMGLRVAVDRLLADSDRLQRHARLAAACRHALQAGGLTLHPSEGFSNTVTAFFVPEGLSYDMILEKMQKEEKIMLSGSFGCFGGKLLRIGHMGENCQEEALLQTLSSLENVLRGLSWQGRGGFCAKFHEKME